METIKSIKIRKISVIKNEDVYDLTTEKNHNFFANNILVHNCGEQFLPHNGSCNLGSLNIVKYVKGRDYDYKALEEDLPYVVRCQDAVIDLSKYPSKEIKDEALSKRRVGIGYLGYGSSLYMLSLRYGSRQALEATEKLAKFITNQLYQASALLAAEKGQFPLYDEEKYLQSKFVKQALTKETIELIKKHGLRNSHLTSIQPTGNTSVLSNVVSGGLEPVIDHFYVRSRILGEVPDDLDMPLVSWDKQTYECKNTDWEWIKEGDEHLLRLELNGNVYKFDKNRGLLKEEKVYDYAVLELGDAFDPSADYAVTINNLSVDDHVNTMAVFAKYIDSAISKTVNLPNDYPYEDFKDVYLKAYKSGYIKGFTTYRWGTMATVISDGSVNKLKPQFAERPKSLPCDIHRITVNGEKWIVFVGIMDKKPFEVFTGKIELVDLPDIIKSGFLVKVKSGNYDFEHENQVLVKNISHHFDNSVHDALTRMVSGLLRAGGINIVVEQLSKSKGVVTDFSKSIVRALKKYLKDGDKANVKCLTCGSENVTFSEGCYLCKDCNSSACA